MLLACSMGIMHYAASRGCACAMYGEVILAEIIVVANQTWWRLCLSVLAIGLRDCSAAPGSMLLELLDRVGDPAECAAGCGGWSKQALPPPVTSLSGTPAGT